MTGGIGDGVPQPGEMSGGDAAESAGQGEGGVADDAEITAETTAEMSGSAPAAGGEPGPAAAEEGDPTAVPLPGGRRRGRIRRWLSRQPRWRRRSILALVSVVMVLVTFTATLGVALFAEGAGTPAASARSSGHDALWLGHAWVGWDPGTGKTAKTDADFEQLAAQVQDSGIKDLFVHTGPFGFDGMLDPAKSPRAEWFVAAVHRELPGVRVQAWLGQVVGGSDLDLESAATRRNVVAGVEATLARGFDGVHFDFEPVDDGDHGFLDVLAASHDVTRRYGARLSVSVPQAEPTPDWQAAGDFLVGHDKWWTTDYLSEVAQRSDQIAVMAYDTSLPTAWSFRGYVARQTEVARKAVPKSVGLLIGVPAFHTGQPGHHGRAETMEAAVRGVRLGLGAGDGDREFGVALYVDYGATQGDWQAYRTGWLRPAS